MSRKAKLNARLDSGLVEVKSRFDAEFRRFSLDRVKPPTYDEFESLIKHLHGLGQIPFLITYRDTEGDILPINNNENFHKALSVAKPILRIFLQQKGQNDLELSGYGTAQRRKPAISKLLPSTLDVRPNLKIGLPEDFRRVSAIIDVDVIPKSQRRVRLIKNGIDRPLGFFIRDGTSIRVTTQGLEKVPGIFVSRLVAGGLAESTGLLAVNDEILEVNGIEVAGKTLDQVTDMMVANSNNLIVTIKPVNQLNNINPHPRFSENSKGQICLTENSTHSLDYRRSNEPFRYDNASLPLSSSLQKLPAIRDEDLCTGINDDEIVAVTEEEDDEDDNDDVKEFVKGDLASSILS